MLHSASSGYVAVASNDGPLPPPSTVGDEQVVEPFRPELSLDFIPPTAGATPAAPQYQNAAPQEILDTRPFTEADALDCLRAYVASTWFSSRKMAQQAHVTEIVASNTFVAEMMTFVEMRKLVPVHRPLRETQLVVDGPHMGVAPGPWDLPAHPPHVFDSASLDLKVPHTEEVRVCFECRGRGELLCMPCSGRGFTRCSTCDGHGHIRRSRTNSNGTTEWYTDHCIHCHHGQIRCSFCHTRGWKTCHVCDGFRNLVHYLTLRVEWTTKNGRAVIDARDNNLSADERTSLINSNAMVGAQGPLVHQEEDVVLPICTESSPSIRINMDVNNAINRLLNEARDPSVLQHRQRLSIRGVPVYRVTFLYNTHAYNAWVLGTDRTVHAPSLPRDIMRMSIAVLLLILLIAAVVGGAVALWYFVF